MARPPIHPLFRAALAATPDYVHATPIHMGGPQPMVPRGDQNEIVRWCAELMLPLVRGSESRARFADLIGQARGLGPAAASDKRDDVCRALNALRAGVERDDPLMLATFVAITVKRPDLAPRNAVRTARSAVIRAAHILALHHMPPEYFLDQLDDRLMRAELTGCARRHCKDIADRLEAIAYRGGDDKGDTVVWVARIRPHGESSASTWAALVRRIGFHWSEGPVNEALAIVPEDHLERAAAAAFA